MDEEFETMARRLADEVFTGNADDDSEIIEFARRVVAELTGQPVAIASMPYCRLDWMVGETVDFDQVQAMCEAGVKLYALPTHNA